MGEALEIAKVLVKPTMKLLDMVGDAIGIAYEPRHKRKMVDATVYEINAIGEAMRNAADLPIVYNQDGVAINSEDFNRLMQRAGTRLVLQETIKQHNIESVIDNAYEILEKEENCSEEPVEQGWINRFFDSVADVSDEDLQMLWGKILAGEIKKPKSYSLRTLETIKNLSRYEAELFHKIIPFVLNFQNYYIISQNMNILEKYGVHYYDLLVLDECNLLKMQADTGITADIGSQTGVFSNNRLALFKGTEGISGKIEYNVYPLTSAGFELFTLLETETNSQYFSDFIKDIVKKNPKLKMEVCIYEVTKIDEDKTIHYQKEPIEIL